MDIEWLTDCKPPVVLFPLATIPASLYVAGNVVEFSLEVASRSKRSTKPTQFAKKKVAMTKVRQLLIGQMTPTDGIFTQSFLI